MCSHCNPEVRKQLSPGTAGLPYLGCPYQFPLRYWALVKFTALLSVPCFQLTFCPHPSSLVLATAPTPPGSLLLGGTTWLLSNKGQALGAIESVEGGDGGPAWWE